MHDRLAVINTRMPAQALVYKTLNFTADVCVYPLYLQYEILLAISGLLCVESCAESVGHLNNKKT